MTKPNQEEIEIEVLNEIKRASMRIHRPRERGEALKIIEREIEIIKETETQSSI